MHMHTCMHSKPKHAHNFQMSSVAIFKPFLTENYKLEAMLQVGIDETKLFQSNNHLNFES